MKATIKPLTNQRAWKVLGLHFKRTKELPLRKLFAAGIETGANG
jgi:hypothetical protein